MTNVGGTGMPILNSKAMLAQCKKDPDWAVREVRKLYKESRDRRCCGNCEHYYDTNIPGHIEYACDNFLCGDGSITSVQFPPHERCGNWKMNTKEKLRGV